MPIRGNMKNGLWIVCWILLWQPASILAAGITLSTGLPGVDLQGARDVQFSADGRYLAFLSSANTLVGDISDGVVGLFVFDRLKSTIQRVATSRNGEPMGMPALSADGQVVAFMSYDSNLVPNDTNNQADVFVHELATHITTRVNVSSTGMQADYNGLDLAQPSLSADGRYVAFASRASNLVPGDTNERQDTFVYDRQTRKIERVSIASNGTEGRDAGRNIDNMFEVDFFLSPSISGDGRFVMFSSNFNNLVADDINQSTDVFIHDRQTHATKRVSVDSNGRASSQQSFDTIGRAISPDGRYVLFNSFQAYVPEDTNGLGDAYLHDRQTRRTERISVRSDGSQMTEGRAFGDSISAEGRYIGLTATGSLASQDTNVNTFDTYIFDRNTRQMELLSISDAGAVGNDHSYSPTLSGDGRFAVFYSNATNLVAGVSTPGLYTLRDRILERERTADISLRQQVVDLSATFSSAKTVPFGLARKRRNVEFVIKIRNKGPGRARKLALTTTVSSGCSIKSHSVSRPAQCNSASVSVCRLSPLAQGVVNILRIAAQVTNASGCTVKASVNASPVDPNPFNNALTKIAQQISGQ